MADNSTDIDFPALALEAQKMVDAADTNQEGPEVVAATPEVAAVVPGIPEVSPAVAPVDDELDPDVIGDRPVRVKVGNEWRKVPLKEVAGNYWRAGDYTQKTQALAEQRRQVEAERAAQQAAQDRLAQYDAFHADKNRVLGYLQQAHPELFQPSQQTQQVDPNEIATVAQAREMLAAQQREFQQNLQRVGQTSEQKIAQAIQDFRNEQQTNAYRESFKSTVKEVFNEYPILSKVKMAEDIIRLEVRKMEPTTEAEAHEAFRTVAKAMYEELTEGFTTLSKTKVKQAEKLKTAGIEPPGGSGIQLQPNKGAYDKGTNKLDWKGLAEQAKALVNQ